MNNPANKLGTISSPWSLVIAYVKLCIQKLQSELMFAVGIVFGFPIKRGREPTNKANAPAMAQCCGKQPCLLCAPVGFV